MTSTCFIPLRPLKLTSRHPAGRWQLGGSASERPRRGTSNLTDFRNGPSIAPNGQSSGRMHCKAAVQRTCASGQIHALTRGQLVSGFGTSATRKGMRTKAAFSPGADILALVRRQDRDHFIAPAHRSHRESIFQQAAASGQCACTRKGHAHLRRHHHEDHVDHRRRAQHRAAAGRPVQAQAPATEKCFGVAKAGKNDCQTATSSCAGTAKKDHEASAWLSVPKGTCAKIAGGSLTAAKSSDPSTRRPPRSACPGPTAEPTFQDPP